MGLFFLSVFWALVMIVAFSVYCCACSIRDLILRRRKNRHEENH